MPETGSAQGALPLRSAYPARDLTHSKGRRAISPDKTTGSFRRRFVPEPGVLNGKGKTRPFACARSSFLAVRARKAPSPRPDTGFLHAVLAGPDGTFPASSGFIRRACPFYFLGLRSGGTPHHSVLAIFRRGYTLGEEDEECSDVVLLSRPAVFSGGPVGWFFRRGRPSAGQPENEAAWYRSVRSGLSRFKDGGGYKAQPAGAGSPGAESLPLGCQGRKARFPHSGSQALLLFLRVLPASS